MPKQMQANRVMNGTFGKVWIDAEQFGNVKSFEAKLTLSYEAVNISDDLGTHQKYMGHEGAGTAVLHKIDTSIGKKVANGIKTGKMPEINIVASLSDPGAYGAERVKLIGVTFDEVTLMKFTNKELQEEEVPFKFSDFEFIDTI